jgi:hypothetical protein
MEALRMNEKAAKDAKKAELKRNRELSKQGAINYIFH